MKYWVQSFTNSPELLHTEHHVAKRLNEIDGCMTVTIIMEDGTDQAMIRGNNSLVRRKFFRCETPRTECPDPEANLRAVKQGMDTILDCLGLQHKFK